jgi:hypothetical protein
MRKLFSASLALACMAGPAIAEENRVSVDLMGLELSAPGLSGSAETIGVSLEYHLTDRVEIRGFYANGSAEGAPIETAQVNLRYLHPVFGPVSAGPRLDYAWGAVRGADASETLAGVSMRLDIGERSRIDLSAGSLTGAFGDEVVYELDTRLDAGNGLTFLGGVTHGRETAFGQSGTILSLGGEYALSEGAYGSLRVNHAEAAGVEGHVNGVQLGIGLAF